MVGNRIVIALLLLAGAATPAAAGVTRIPEPDTLAIFLLAGVGLLIGRRLAR